jgi:hypothetical protein
MRVYIIGNDGITLCREPPAAVNEGEIAPCPTRREFSKNGRVLSLGSRGPRSRLVPPPWTEFASDSPLEQAGFELPVPLATVSL